MRQRLGEFVAMVALVGVVAAKFLQERNDLRRLLIAEDGKLERELVASRRQLIVGAARDQDHRREIEGDGRGRDREIGEGRRIGRGAVYRVQPDIEGEPSEDDEAQDAEHARLGHHCRHLGDEPPDGAGLPVMLGMERGYRRNCFLDVRRDGRSFGRHRLFHPSARAGGKRRGHGMPSLEWITQGPFMQNGWAKAMIRWSRKVEEGGSLGRQFEKDRLQVWKAGRFVTKCASPKNWRQRWPESLARRPPRTKSLRAWT